MKVLWQWVPCERNSYNFIPIFLKLCTCFLHGLKMCMHTCHISHCEIKSHRIWPMWKPNSHKVIKTHRIFRPSYNTFNEEINIHHTLLWLSQTSYIIIKVFGELQSDLCKNHTEFYQISLKNLPHLTEFSPQLMACMCMWFGCNPCFNFCHFFHFTNFVIFWPQILWKCCDSGYLVRATPYTILYQSFWNFAHVFRDQARGRFGRNSRPRGRNFALNWAQGEVGVSLKKKNFFFFFCFVLEFSSNHSTKQAVMAI